MLFNSLQFLIFYPVVTLLYFLLPFRYRWILLLAASCVFYCAFIPIYILILFFTILVDYIAGIYIEKSTGRRRKAFLIMSIVSNVGVLAIFKYFNFFLSNYNHLLHILHMPGGDLELWKIILPIGLSFHTFQTMSYTIEVYRGHQKAERHLGIYALYVMFYPQLMAGPIERPQNLLHQFYEEHPFDWGNLWWGLRQMLWGLFKKSVIADRLAEYVNPVFSHPHAFHQGNVILGVVFFSFQVYCDFSGYSDIAIGAARVMGFKLMRNFNRPFTAPNISEFWRRWHISLSTWFRDYLYISMGGNRGGFLRRNLNLMIIFLVSGLWHGASWTFVIWGGLNGFYLIVYNNAKALLSKWNWKTHRIANDMVTGAGILLTFAAFTFSLVFFRTGSLPESIHMITYAAHIPQSGWFEYPVIGELRFGGAWFILAWGLIGALMISEEILVRNKNSFTPYPLLDSIWLGVVLFMVLTMGVFNQNAFVYFQF